MLRIVGVCLLLIGTGGYSVCFCSDMRKRLACLHEMKRMYELLYSQIAYCSAAFPEACRMAQESMRPPFSDMLHEAYEETQKNTGKPFPQIWQDTAKQCLSGLPLKKGDMDLLAEFARSLGYADIELQKRAVSAQMSALEERIREMETHMAEREKMAVSLGVMGGLLAAVLLV